MKRDFDLIRQILIQLENEPTCSARLFARDFPEWQSETVNYHIWLLIQSGLIIGVCNNDVPREQGFVCYGACLTWQGHEFLATIRDNGTWQKIRTLLADKAVDLSLEAVKVAAAAGLKTLF